MKLAFKITFKKGPKIIAVIEGDAKEASDLTIEEVVEGVSNTEALLERLTGYRVHIEQVS